MANNYLGSFAIGSIAQSIQIGSALALLPFIGIYLSPEDIGVWYLLLTFHSMLLLIDSGSSQGFIRFYALAKSGVSKFTDSGFDVSSDTCPNARLLASLLVLNRYGHRLLAVLFLFVGVPLIWLIVAREYSNDFELWVTVFGGVLFTLGSALYLASSWMASYLFSSEKQSDFFRFLIVYRVLFLIVSVLMLVLDFGVLGLGFANLLTVLVAVSYLRKKFLLAAQNDLSTGVFDRTLVSDIWIVWAKNVAVAIGGFLGNRGVLLIVAAGYGLSTVGRFGISMQLFFAVLAISQLVFQVAAPRMSQLRATNCLKKLRSLVTRLTVYFVVLYGVGALVVILVVPRLLEYFNGNIQLLAVGPLLVMAMIYALEGNHSNFALALSTENKIPYFFPSIVTAAVIVIGTGIVTYLEAPLLWVLLVQGLTHLLYNNWKWPLMFYSSTRASSRNQV
jgi:O-antigen/teichoic acid export membrane protein